MTQPAPYAPTANFATETGTVWGLHLDQELAKLAQVTAAIIGNLGIIQRDDTALSNQTVGANTFASDALALVAGVQSTSSRWVPRGFWVTATLYNATDVIETGSPGTAYVCTVQHTSGVFATDHAAGKWVVLSAPRTIVSADVTGALGFTPVNRAGDTMLGALTLISGSKLSGATYTDTLLASQALVTMDKGLYSAYQSSLGAIVYGFASNVLRTSGTQLTVGAQFSGYSQDDGEVFGENVNAIALSGSLASLVSHEADIGSYESTNNSPKIGYNPVFKNRGDGLTNPGQYSYAFPFGTFTNAGGGLGGNLYNSTALAIWISSQPRTATGEYCGWTRGILFDSFSLDSEFVTGFPGNRAYPIGIDFSEIHYYGGSDPVTGYNMEAAIAFRDLQGILWNRDPTAPESQVNKIRTHFNPSTGRWVLTNAGAERFAVDVATGAIYTNGTIFSGGASLSGANVWTSTGSNTFQGPVTFDVGTTYVGNALRIKAPFTTGTIANRTIFQTSDANSSTEVGAIPSGASTGAGLYVISDSAAANGIVGRIGVDATGVQIASTFIGAASFKPLDLAAGGGTQVRINEAGQVLIGTLTAPAANIKFRVAGIVQFDNAVAFAVNRNGVAQTITTGTFTKVLFTTKEFDQNTSFNTAFSRFTPPAGIYALSACLAYQATVDQKRYATIIYKNGAAHKNNNLLASGTDSLGTSVTCVVQANGTDFFEVFTWHNSGGNEDLTGLTTDCWFSGCKIA